MNNLNTCNSCRYWDKQSISLVNRDTVRLGFESVKKESEKHKDEFGICNKLTNPSFVSHDIPVADAIKRWKEISHSILEFLKNKKTEEKKSIKAFSCGFSDKDLFLPPYIIAPTVIMPIITRSSFFCGNHEPND